MRVLALLIISLLLLGSCKSSHEFYGFFYDKPAQDFKLKDQDGQSRSLSSITRDGSIVLLFFGYTNCPDICPDSLSKMQKTIELLKKDSSRVKAVFISVDPERDTPAVLKCYMSYFGPSFIGLTGKPEEIASVAKAYNAYYTKVKSDSALGYLIDHTATIYLITPDMKVKLLYTMNKQEPKKIAEDIRFLLSEK
ncbi:MAG: SCO family protein [Aquificaceae bacterium]|nr:SCO family protein [Aquificaceae bacterium]